MENVILGLLIIQSLTLYELNRAFKQGISMFYSASYGSLQVAEVFSPRQLEHQPRQAAC